MHVLLVHGYLDVTRVFGKMEAVLREAGHTVHAPELESKTGAQGLERLGRQIARIADTQIPSDEPFVLVAFSMGTIISRIFLQELGGAERCARFISLSGPHHGTVAGFAVPGQGAREMRPGSPLLQRLNADASSLAVTRPVSIWTPLDLVILPANSSRVSWAENISVNSPLHPLVPRHPKTMEIVTASLREAGAKKLSETAFV